MAEKKLNTRIQLKIDTLSNWNNSTIVLKTGELALATVAASAGTGLVEPVVMAKIGNGTGTFKELDWNFYAKASDVLASCKDEASLKAFINGVITEAGVATNEALATLAGRVTNTESDIDALETLVGATKVSEQISAAIAALHLDTTYEKVGVAAGLVDDLATGQVATNTAAIEALETAVEGKQTAGDYATKAEARGYADAKDAAIETAQEAADAAQADVNALGAKVGAVADGKTVIQLIEEAKTSATYDDTAVKADIQANADAIEAIEDDYLKSADKTELQNAINAKAAQSDFAALKEDVDAFFADADLTANAKDTLKELQEYIASDETAASAMAASIKANSDAIDVVEGRMDTAENKITALETASATHATTADLTTLAGRVTTSESEIDTLQTEMDAVEAKATANETAIAAKASQKDLTTATSRISTVEVKVATLEDEMDEAQGDIVALEGLVGTTSVEAQINAAIAALSIGDYAKAADLTAEISRAKTAEAANATAAANADAKAVAAQEAIDALAAIASTGNVNDLVQTTGDVLVFYCGTASEVI